MNRSYYDIPVDGDPGDIPQYQNQSPDADAGGPHNPPPHPRRRLQYEHTGPTRRQDSASASSNLRLPANSLRPRSVPPPYDPPRRRRRRSRSRSSSSSSSASPRRPDRARSVIKDTFTDSRSGVGVGILGAIVGGLVAHEVSHATVRARNRKAATATADDDDDNETRKSEPGKDGEKARRLATLAGAVIGGLGANAIGKKFEESRDRDKEKRDDWVRRWGEEGGFWQNEWGPPLDHTRRRSWGRGAEGYEVDYEERKPQRRSGDAYRH